MPERADKHEAPLVLEVERFEHVAAGAERVLLRIDGRYGDRPGKRVLDAMLFVDDGLAVHRHAPVGDDIAELDSWLWRAAFDVPTAYLTDERTRFALESDPGCLIDLPRPSRNVVTSAVPLTSRAAHLARRYAGAIAVLLTVAIAPGGLPAMARTEVLRVHNPDGSVVYMSSDGQTLAEVPADAVVVDQNAAPAPAPVDPAAPAPAQTQTDTQPQSPPPVQPDGPSKAGWVQKSNGADALPAGGRTQPSGPGNGTHSRPQPQKQPQHQSQPAAPAQQAAPAPTPRKQKSRKRHAHRSHHPAPPAHVQGAPSGATEQLQPVPALLASPGSDDAKLHALNRLSGNDTQSPASDSTLPTKDLQNMGDLVGGAAHGHTTGPPATTLPVPTDTAPPLIPLGTGDEPQTTGGQPQTTGGQPQPHTRDNHP
ncbi:MAG: hypothetical protein QOF37_2157, partial [Thermoleophilaceae bacterium]|nr:hypothetical protein [Thermoleophilaceae bacterium]